MPKVDSRTRFRRSFSSQFVIFPSIPDYLYRFHIISLIPLNPSAFHPTTVIAITFLPLYSLPSAMADVVMLVSAGSALLTGAHRSKYSQFPAGNRSQVERAAPTASDTLQPKSLTAPVADTPDVNPSSAIMRPFQVARDGSDEVLDEAQYDSDPPSHPPKYSRYETVPRERTSHRIQHRPSSHSSRTFHWHWL